MDSGICQTSSASPAQPGVSPNGAAGCEAVLVLMERAAHRIEVVPSIKTGVTQKFPKRGVVLIGPAACNYVDVCSGRTRHPTYRTAL